MRGYLEASVVVQKAESIWCCTWLVPEMQLSLELDISRGYGSEILGRDTMQYDQGASADICAKILVDMWNSLDELEGRTWPTGNRKQAQICLYII